MRRLRGVAWIVAYLVLLLLAVIWAADALVALSKPLLDIGRTHVGDSIITIARLLDLSPDSTMSLALAFAGIKLMLAAYLLMTVVVAAHDWAVQGTSDNAMLDVGVFLSAFASVMAALPIATQCSVSLQAALGEVLLAAIASGLALYGQGLVAPPVSSRAMALEAARSR